MAFVKKVKNNAYFKRYQVKYRRRREAKTDYGARRLLVKQDKNKYNAAKHRLVVRITNTQCIAQVIYSTIQGDRTLTQATSKELPRYGIKVGLANYASCYATGLLVARRMLKKLNLDEAFEGKTECDGEDFHIEEETEEERRPFKVILDVGLHRTTVGAKVFAAMKGAADGGLHVPHNTKRFPGYKAPEERGADAEYNAEAHRDRIVGQHVADYMESMEEDNDAKYQQHFSKFIEAGIGADDVVEMYEKAHEAIRADPEHKKKVSSCPKPVRSGHKITSGDKSWTAKARLSKKDRKNRCQEKIRKYQAALQA